MPKTLVTHKNPDLDAITSLWLLVRFDQSRYGDAEIVLVPAGNTYRDEIVDSDSEVVHADVGYGRFDHHQPGAAKKCATELVYESLIQEGLVSPSDTSLKEMVEYVHEIDFFQDCFWDEGSDSRYAFYLSEIIPALHRLQIHDNEAVVRMVFVMLDGVYQRLKDRSNAMVAIEDGIKFESLWGQSIMVVTGADDVSKIAQRMGYDLVLIVDQDKGYLKIKLRPDNKHNLDSIYAKICERDDPSGWFYHNSGLMLFSGSDKGVSRVKTKITPEELLELIKKIYK